MENRMQNKKNITQWKLKEQHVLPEHTVLPEKLIHTYLSSSCSSALQSILRLLSVFKQETGWIQVEFSQFDTLS